MRFISAFIFCTILAIAGCSGGNNSSTSNNPKPPVANAGGPYTGTVVAALTFNASGSTDPQSQTLTYAWNFGDGATSTGVNPSHSYSQQDTYTVSLTATNTSGLSSTTTTMAAIGPAPQPPTANAGGPYFAVAGTVINFDGGGSTDPQGQSLTYSWNFGDGTTASGVNPSHTYTAAGTYTVALTVTDTSKLTETAQVNVIVTPSVGAAIMGTVLTGLKPIVGAHVYLLAANTTGYGQPSLSLLDPAATGSSDSIGAYTTSGSSGNFDIPGGYSCASDTQIYLYASGGDAGSGINPSSGLLASIGNCPSSTLSVSINEVSTIATAYGLSGFATDATHVSSSGTSLARMGVVNAAATVANLETLSTGLALAATATGNGIAPQTKTNTLANILASCVNTGVSCGALLSTATSTGTSTGVHAVDTASAAINLAHYPVSNISALYSLAASASVYAPALSVQPNDFLLGLRFPDGSITNPIGIAVDGFGNVWFVNDGGTNPIANGSVVKLSNSGAPLSGANGFTGNGIFSPYGIAIDLSGNAWITNDQVSNSQPQVNPASVTELSSVGAFLSGGSSGNAIEPLGVAIDGTGNAWIGGYLGGDLIELSQSGSVLSDIRTGTFPGPEGVAIDAKGNIWAGSAGSVVEFSTSGVGPQLSTYTGGGINGAWGIAIDGAGNVWIANANNGPTGNNSVTKLSGSGVALSPSTGFTGGGLSAPYALAIDGAGNVWVVSPQAGTVNELSNSGAPMSPATGFVLDQSSHLFSSPYGIAIDPSGNVWLTRTGNLTDDIYEIVGAAAPVVTPLAAGVKNNMLGSRP